MGQREEQCPPAEAVAEAYSGHDGQKDAKDR